MKTPHRFSITFFGTGLVVLVGLSLTLSGCSESPKIDSATFGTVVTKLPELPNRPESFSIPASVEDMSQCETKKLADQEREK